MEHLHKTFRLPGSNPSAEFKCMDHEIYSPLDASSWVTIDLYALRRYNSLFIEVTELKLNVQLTIGLKSSVEIFRSPELGVPSGTPYLSAVLLSRVWRGSGLDQSGSGVWIQVYFAPIDEDKMEAFLKHSKVQIFHYWILFSLCLSAVVVVTVRNWDEYAPIPDKRISIPDVITWRNLNCVEQLSRVPYE